MEKWIRTLAKARWFIVLGWIVLAGGLMASAQAGILPDLTQIIRQTEAKFIPADADSMQAMNIANQINPDNKSRSNAVIVLHREGGIQEGDRQWLQGKIKQLNTQREALEIVGVTSLFEMPELAQKLESKDKTTLLTLIDFAKPDNAPTTQENLDVIRETLEEGLPAGITAELTGSAPISTDFQKSSEEGLKKTEMLTVVLVLAILLIVFRSPIAPLIPLFTIALSYLVSRTLVGVAADMGMPVSSFTESFLIAVLFGAGTDYCILLIQRFREELSHGHDRVEALVRTMRTVGKTVIFSASTVLIAFFLIGFAQFGMYQSAVGVSLGMLVTLLAGLTLTPALLILLGPKMFWPVRVKPGQGHGESKLWGRMAALSARRPLAVLLTTVLIAVPLVMMFHGKRSFDDIAEINPNAGSVQGFNTVKEKFGAGEVFPVTATITSAASMRTPEALAAIEASSAIVAKAAHVAEVRSATRPLGQQIGELTVPDQLAKTTQAIGDVRQGVQQVADGFGAARTELQQGTAPLAELGSGLTQMAASTRDAQQGLRQVGGGLTELRSGLAATQQGAAQAETTVASMGDDLARLAEANPALGDDPAYQALLQKQLGLAGALPQLSGGLGALTQGAGALSPAVNQIGAGLGQLADGQGQAADGIGRLQTGLGQLERGLGDGVAGLRQAADGLGQIGAAQQTISREAGKQIAGWHLPADVLDSPDFKRSLEVYMSPDGKITKLEIILSSHPYSKEAMDAMDELRRTIAQSFHGSAIVDADVKLAGTTAQYHELDRISNDDFIRTGVLVLLGIYLVLALLLRSILAPLYILISLAFNYLITMGIIEFLFVQLLGYPGLSWTVSFFVFLMIVALGVDYSIFLMARFKEEYRPGGVIPAMTKAMTTTGGVIISAAVIMGGTFAAFMYSGVTTLVQIGAGIVIGLGLYTTVFMGLVVPAIAMLFGEANWWPLKRIKTGGEAREIGGSAASGAGSAQVATVSSLPMDASTK
ncbi:MMPL family transporter [Paenibacillus koleovorans]|uniref:MMPL family transporter n=1 Tax=Paenibacillus koleovorans TaxID=121608 RepID=UPI000FD83813|nr:MMPL family transporter [Paenibacillus koleovorans]